MIDKCGIFCIEGEWEADLTDRSSIQPLMEFLASSDELLPPIYRRVATKESFEYFVCQWKNHPEYNIGYLSFHGEKGSLSLGRDKLGLSELGKWLEGSCHKKHLILSSCKTLSVSPTELNKFRRLTGARSVSGYSKSPDWIESSAFDVILMTNLLYHDSPSKAERWLREHCEGLMQKYGFIINYRTRKKNTTKSLSEMGR